MKKIFKQFNQPETLLVLTSYAGEATHSKMKQGFNAIGWHSERVLKALSEKRKVIVCAEKLESNQNTSINKNLLVSRQWEKGNIFSFASLLHFILRLNRVKSIYVQFEFNVFGGILPNLIVLMLLGFLRLLGKKVTFELHQVITDIKKLEKHIHITNPLLQKFFNFSLAIFYSLLGVVASELIVFEEDLKTRLKKFVRAGKINVLSLAVEKRQKLPVKKARKRLGLREDEFVVLLFGFINGYKGIDWMLKAMSKMQNKNIRLLIAGGENPYLKDDPQYQKFYQGILTEISKHTHVTHHGFIPEEQITTYFSASDVLCLPYEVFMSASGPFSHALMYDKPVLLSERLSSYAASADFAQAMGETGVSLEDLVFNFTRESLLKHLDLAQKDRKYLSRLKAFTVRLGELRSMENITNRLNAIVSPQAKLETPQIALVEA